MPWVSGAGQTSMKAVAGSLECELINNMEEDLQLPDSGSEANDPDPTTVANSAS